MSKNGLTIIVAVIFCLILSYSSAVAVPLTMTFQGRLLDATGHKVDGFFDIEYRMYTAPTGGTLLWNEMIPDVKVDSGIFTSELGRINSFFDVFTELYIGIDVWMEVQIEGSPLPQSPRTRLAGSPFAMVANGVSGSHPIGGTLDTAYTGMQVSDAGASLRIRVNPSSQTTGRFDVTTSPNGVVVAGGDVNGDGIVEMTAGADGGGGGEPGAMFHVSSPGHKSIEEVTLSGKASISLNGLPPGVPIEENGLMLQYTDDSSRVDINGELGPAGRDGISMTARKPGKDQQEYRMVSLNGLPPGEPIRGITLTTEAAEAHVAMGDVDGDGSADLVTDSTGATLTMRSVGETGVHRTHVVATDDGCSIAVNEDGTHNITMSADSGSSSIAVNEDGTHNITMSADSGGLSIAVNEEGTHNIIMNADSGSSSIAVNEEGTHNVTISADSGGAGIAVNEEGTHNITLDSDGDGYFAGKVGIGVVSPTHPLELASGAHCTAGGVFTNASDKNLKENFEEVNGEKLLDRIGSLDITEWNYKNESEDIKHIGPTAQDFYKAFGVGGDDKSISTVDPSGIALAAIKELYKKSKEVDELKKQLDELTKQVEKLAKEHK